MRVMVLAYPGPTGCSSIRPFQGQLRWQVHWLRRIWTIVCLDKQKIDEEIVETHVKPESGSAKLRPSEELTVPEDTPCKSFTGSS
jgi:hypothetical protein